MRFENTDDVKGAEFVNVDLSDARFSNADLTGARMRDCELTDAHLSGYIDGLVVNNVEVAPLIRAELARRFPERTKLIPADADGAREAWSVTVALWRATKARALALPAATLAERVDDEWSFVETLRHLIFAVDFWITDSVFGRSDGYYPYGVIPSSMPDPEPYGIDPAVRPALDEVVAVREERMKVVGELIATATDDGLQRPCGDGTVLTCLWMVFEEEWQHNWFANRDLDILTAPQHRA